MKTTTIFYEAAAPSNGEFRPSVGTFPTETEARSHVERRNKGGAKLKVRKVTIIREELE